MQPLGNKILVKDITEKEQKTESGIIYDASKSSPLKKVEIVKISEDSASRLSVGDICLSEKGGVELDSGVWLCNESLLVCKL